jgi:hypothetical protein
VISLSSANNCLVLSVPVVKAGLVGKLRVHERSTMHTSTASHDLTAIKHALELGLILAAIVLAIAAHGGTRQSKSHTTPAYSIDADATPGIMTLPSRG